VKEGAHAFDFPCNPKFQAARAIRFCLVVVAARAAGVNLDLSDLFKAAPPISLNAGGKSSIDISLIPAGRTSAMGGLGNRGA
jgi:hypothetical protein